MKFMIAFALLLAAASANQHCTDCYATFAGIEYDPVTIASLPTVKGQVCSAGSALATCLAAGNCPYYEGIWAATCAGLQCGGCPPLDFCQSTCQFALDLVVNSMANLARLPQFDDSQFQSLMCTAIDSLGQCAQSAAQLDGKPCEIEAKNCPMLQNICPSASCTPTGDITDLLIMAEKYRDLLEAQVIGRINQIKNALQRGRQEINGQLRLIWEITLENAGQRVAAILAFRNEIAKNLGVALARVQVSSNATSTRRRTVTETWTVTVAGNSAASIAISAAVILVAFLML